MRNDLRVYERTQNRLKIINFMMLALTMFFVFFFQLVTRVSWQTTVLFICVPMAARVNITCLKQDTRAAAQITSEDPSVRRR